jgi:spore coat protein U-like protein
MKLVKSVLPAVVLGLLTLGLTSTSAYAGVATGTIAVSVTVANSCTIATNALAFGTYTGAVLNAQTTFAVTCSASGATYNVGLNAGLGGTGATDQARIMLNGTNKLNYNLYVETGHTTNWGNTSTTNWQSYTVGAGAGLQPTVNIYGQIPASQTSAVGAYSDTVTATVTY